MWMVPSREVNETILGVLARYQEIFGVVIYAYVFLSNHLHLLVHAPNGNLDEFLENVNREIARRINYLCKRKGKFWARRYSDQIVLSEADAEKAFLYVTTNPTKHGLVKHCKLWPGVSSYHHCLDGYDREYSFIHYSKKDESGDLLVTKHTLKLTPLPQYAHLSQEERRVHLKELIDQRCKELRRDREQNGQGFLGTEKILVQKRGSLAFSTAESPRPICYSQFGRLIHKFRKNERQRRIRYKQASLRFRLGDFKVDFPRFCHKPPMHRLPRLEPFKAIKELPHQIHA